MVADRIPLFVSGLSRLTRLGLNAELVLRDADISPASMRQPKMYLTTRQYFDFWAAIEALSDDELIGLHLGGSVSSDQLDPASFAALHSRSFMEAMERLARYKRLTCPETIHIETGEQVTGIRFCWLHASGATPQVLADAAFANVDLLARLGAGQRITPKKIELEQPRRNIERYANFFGCPVEAGAEHDRMVYSSACMNQRFVTSNLDLMAALLPGLDSQLEVTSSFSIDQQVKAVLTRMMRGERPSLEDVARYLCLSPRTLQRRLAESQTSYQVILDTVRIETACKLLRDTDLEPGEISFYLGFEEVNSFQRAFHRRTTMTPTQWRRQSAVGSG